MEYRKFSQGYVLRLDPGEEIVGSLTRLVEQERDNKRVSSREFIGGYGDDEDHGFDEEDSPY